MAVINGQFKGHLYRVSFSPPLEECAYGPCEAACQRAPAQGGPGHHGGLSPAAEISLLYS